MNTIQAVNKLRMSAQDCWLKVPQAGLRINLKILNLFKDENVQCDNVSNMILNTLQLTILEGATLNKKKSLKHGME